MELRDSKTYANLMAAYAGESQARVRYAIYGSQARKEGYQQIGDIFDATSHNEQAHAKAWFTFLHDGAVPPTLQNLLDAASGEHYEWSQMYKAYAEEAKAEGFERIAAAFTLVGKIEKEHEERFAAVSAAMQAEQVFKKLTPQKWICSNCGHVHEGVEAPGLCPFCSYPQAFFEVKTGSYGD